jgi:hypothetical protein
MNQLRAWIEDKREFVHRCFDLDARLRSFAAHPPGEGSGWVVPDGFDRLAPSLARSLGVARERSRKSGEQWGLRNLVPRAEIALPSNGEARTHQILFAAHILSRFVDEMENPGRAAGAGLLEEQRSLQEYLGAPHRPRSGWSEELGRWMRERIRSGEGDVLVHWMKTLLDVLKRPTEWRRGVEESLQLLRARGLDEAGFRRVASYLEGVIAPFIPIPGLSSPGQATPPTRDELDLEPVLDAMFVFHCCLAPTEEHGAFRRRLDSTLSALKAAGKDEAARRALDDMGFFFVYRLLADSTDEELERLLSAFR